MICVMDCSNGWNKAKKALETYAAQTNDGSTRARFLLLARHKSDQGRPSWGVGEGGMTLAAVKSRSTPPLSILSRACPPAWGTETLGN